MELKKETVAFLERDFSQAFAHLRQYDQQMWDICKFVFTAYAMLLGASLGIYKYAADKQIDLTGAVLAALGVGAVVGLFMFAMFTRNRVYFVSIARYINAHRHYILSQDPARPEFTRGFYDDPGYPRYFNLFSSHSALSVVIAALNAALFAALTAITSFHCCNYIILAILAGVIAFLAQMVPAWLYLRSREGPSAVTAVFGPATSVAKDKQGDSNGDSTSP